MSRLSAKQLLPILLGTAMAAGGWIQLHQAKQLATPEGESNEVQALQARVDELTKENAVLRSLNHGEAEFVVPEQWIKRIESQTGLAFRSPPVMHRLGQEELRDRVEASQESRRGSGGLEDRQIAYQLLGWLGSKDQLGKQIAALHTTGAVCWFNEVSGEGWVTDRFQPDSIPHQASLLRCLTRILLHQHFPPAAGDFQDDPVRARDALHSGVAAGVEMKFLQDAARSIGFLSVQGDNEANQLLLALPPFVKGLAAFQSMEGKAYADSLLGKGREALLTKLQDPPRRTAEIMFFSEPAVEEKKIATNDPPGEVVLEDSGGALGLRLWLDPDGNGRDARELAGKLVDDRWQLFVTGEQDFHVIWTLELADQSSTADLTKFFCARASVVAGIDAAMEIGKPVKTAEGRWLRVDRMGNTTLRLVNTSDQATADAVK